MNTRMNRKLWTGLIVLSILCGTMFSSPSGSLAESRKGNRKKIMDRVAAASTAEDYQEIARYYKEEAAKAEEKAKEHREMASWYLERKDMGKMSTIVPNRQHCEKLANQYQAAAREFSAMARIFDDYAGMLRGLSAK